MDESRKKGREIRQSSEMTLARYSSSDASVIQPRLGLVENRIKYRIIERLQAMFEGIPLDGSIPVDESHYCQTVISIPISEILTDGSKNYGMVREASRRLFTHIFSYEEENYEWVDFVMLSRVGKRRKGDGDIELTITPDFIRCLAMQGGWQTFYDVEVMCSLNSTYAMRLYELVSRRSGGDHPLSMRMEDLKKMFGLEGKYADPHNFDRKVMDIAKRELDSKAPYTFDYRRERDRQGEWTYRIHPLYQPQFNRFDTEGRSLRRRVALSFCLPKDIRDYLMDRDSFGFTAKEIRNNLDTFLEFMRIKGINQRKTLSLLQENSVRKDNPKGWLIGALRSMVAENVG